MLLIMDEIVTAFSLDLPGSFMTEQWGGSHVFKVGTSKTFKMFGILLPGEDRLTLKTPSPDTRALLIEAEVASMNVHLPRGSWVQLHLDRLDADDICERISVSYGLVRATLPKRILVDLKEP